MIKRSRPAAAVVLVLMMVHVLMVHVALAQPAADAASKTALTLEGRHSVALGFGLLSQAEAGVAGVRAGGMLGSLSYDYWPHPEWSVGARVAVHDAEASWRGTSSVTSLLFGIAFYPEALSIQSTVRPYLSAAVGAYRQSAAGAVHFVGTRTEATPGGALGAGVDAVAWGRVRIGLHAAYHIVTDRSGTLGSMRDAVGPEMTVNVGLLLGGR